MFQYLGNERLQLWFHSPNICATFLVMSVMVSLGLFFWIAEIKKEQQSFFYICFPPLIFLQVFMIALTYSRGSYLACLLSLLIAFIVSRKRICLFFVFIFIATVMLVNDGSSRVKSMFDLGEGSIRNRFLLWKGGCGIIADHYLTGIGRPPAAGFYYTQWYQPLWLNENYTTLISDYLTIAASYGICILFLILTLYFFILIQSYKVWKISHDMFLLYCMCAIVGYMVSSLFSTCYSFWSLLSLLIIIVLIVIGKIIYYIRKFPIRWSQYDFWYPSLVSFTICFGIVVYGKYVNMKIPYTRNHDIISIDNSKYHILDLSPKISNSPTLIFITSDIEDDIRTFLRPAAIAGYRVKAVQLDSGLDSLKNGIRFFPYILNRKTNVYLIGLGSEKAILTLALATHLSSWNLSGIIVHNIPYEWPFDDLSPKKLIEKLKIPLLIIQNLEYEHDGILLERICLKNQIPLYLEVSDQIGYHIINRLLHVAENK